MTDKRLKLFRAVKIVGVSGVGKTTLIRMFLRNFENTQHICFSEFLEKFKNFASQELLSSLSELSGLVLMDEHLEIGGDDLFNEYRDENVVGLFVLEAAPLQILARREKDITRSRGTNIRQIEVEQRYSTSRSFILASQLEIPVLVAKDKTPEGNMLHLVEFVKSIDSSLL